MEEGSSSTSEECLLERILDGKEKPADLSLALLQKITNNFSKERKIGQGGFGAVYKGVFGERMVAVKKIEKIDIDDKLFDREFNCLWVINHENVVRFLGFCSNTSKKPVEKAGKTFFADMRERLFCFEYISGGSLDKYITDELRGLEWETRYKIIIGISKGLCYLHEKTGIIHMDLKPANILLDDKNMVPKITDFGLSRPNTNSHTMAQPIGTIGYIAPEYSKNSKTTPACDIYSLGAIIMELVTGGMEVPNKHNVLRRWRHRWNKPPTPLQYRQVIRCIEIAGRCREQKPKDRPSIEKIINLLSESMDGQTDKELSTYMDDDMLGIEPLELHFHKEISWSVKITNKTKACFAFEIERPSKQYTIRPEKGILTPRCKECLVQITAGAPRVTLNADKFIVRSKKVSEALTFENIPEHIFHAEASKAVDEVDLMVVYEPTKPHQTFRSRENTNMSAEEVPETISRHPSRVTASTTSGYRQARSPLARLPVGTSTHDISAPERMNALLNTALWVVDKALALGADGVLEAWVASIDLHLNMEALRKELWYLQATLEAAASKQISGRAMEQMLWKLRDSAHCADDLLDELDYFRIHDELHGTYDAADQHAKGGVHNLALNARHTARALLGFSSGTAPAEPAGQVAEDARQGVGCCAWPRGRHRSRSNSSSKPNANQTDEEQVTGCMPKLGKLLPCSSSPNVHDDNSGGQSTLCGAPQREHAEETPMLGFNRVDVSEKMKQIVQQLQPLRRDFNTILQSCDRITVPDIAQSRPITTGRSIEPKLYGRDDIMNSIIHDMTKGIYHSKDLTVLPIVGPGGIGKTTLIQHIYHNKEVQNHFQVVIWVCVSLSFNLNKLLEDIKTSIPPVDGEKDGRAEELIEQRLKSKRFLLVLDDIWECSNEDDWAWLLLALKTSQGKGSMILVTTRFPAMAKMVGTVGHSIELEGLESKYFRELFHAFIFGDDQSKRDHSVLLETGDKIMEKIKGSPLAAKTVGRLLRKNLNLRHWIMVLESKEWEGHTSANDIMPALKLSYDYLPFHQQQCFSCSALFPEDHKYSTTELINLWIGLDILQTTGLNHTLEAIGLRNINDLVTHGFFKEEETDRGRRYVMHDLLHDLALKVASRECLTLHHSNVGSVQIQPSIRHLSIFRNYDDPMAHENIMSQLRKLKTRLKVKQLRTLMFFGNIDESFGNILGDLLREANALRVLHLDSMSSPVESMLHNLSTLVHLRYLYLGIRPGRKMHLPLAISRLYHLRILNLEMWHGGSALPKDLSNLAKLHRFYTPSDELHSDIPNVGKLVLLEELKVFRVNKENEGFEPEQLAHLTNLRELGIYNLENIHTKEDAANTKLIEKNYLERLTLNWDSARSNIKPDVEAVVLESLQPYRYLEELCIRGHGGPSCPTWLGDELAVDALQSLHLDGVSWQCLPSLGMMWGLDKLILERIAALEEFVIEKSFCRLIKLTLVGLGSFKKWVPSQDAHMFPLLQVLIIRDCPKLFELPFSNPNQDWKIDWFPKLQELEINSCPEFSLVARIPWTEALCHAYISDVKLLQKFEYFSKSYKVSITGKDDLQSLDQVLAFSNLTGLESLILRKCPPLESKHLLMLTSLKKLDADSLDGLIMPLGGEKWQHPVECLDVHELRGASGKKLTELLTHLPKLSKLNIIKCDNITQPAVGVDMQQHTTSAAAAEVEKREDGLLVLPAHLSDSLQELFIYICPKLVLVDPSTFLPARGGGGGLQALQSLRSLTIQDSPKFLSSSFGSLSSSSCNLFPSSLQILNLKDVEGMGTLEPLSNLTSLTRLDLRGCGADLRCKGLGPLLTDGGQLRELGVIDSPIFFAGWDSNPRRVLLQDDDGGEGHQIVSPPTVSSSKLKTLYTDDAMGLLAAPICSLLSSSLTELHLFGICQEIERFTKEQEDALHLLSSLQELVFMSFGKLQHLPAGLHKLTMLKELVVSNCLAVRSLPKDGLPKSLQVLDVSSCGNKELKQQCRGLVGTIPRIRLERGD